MKFTFGIITKNKNNFGNDDPSSSEKNNIMKCIESINNLEIPEYEIIIVGGENIYNQDNIIHFEFDDTINPLWITAKKNIITKNAKYDNIVFTHDYVEFLSDWYDGFLKALVTDWYGPQWAKYSRELSSRMGTGTVSKDYGCNYNLQDIKKLHNIMVLS